MNQGQAPLREILHNYDSQDSSEHQDSSPPSPPLPLLLKYELGWLRPLTADELAERPKDPEPQKSLQDLELPKPTRKFVDAKVERNLRKEIEKLKALTQQGEQVEPYLIKELRTSRKTQNPEALFQWIDSMSLDEIGSTLNKKDFDPHRVALDKDQYYEGLLRRQSEMQTKKHEEMQRERAKRRAFFTYNQATGKPEALKTSMWDAVAAPQQLALEVKFQKKGKKEGGGRRILEDL